MGHEIIGITSEPSYGEAPGTVAPNTLGTNLTVDSVSIDNSGERMRVPAQADPDQTIYQNFEGNFSISGTMTTGDTGWLQYLFATSASPYAFQTGTAKSARLYLGADPGAGTVERELMGAIIQEATLSVSVDENVTFEISGMYGDEQKNTALTQATAIQPSGDPLIFHGGSLSIGGTSLVGVQSATFSLNNQARFLRQVGSRHPYDARMGGHETQLELERIYDLEDDIAGIGYGEPDGTAPVDNPSSQSGSLEFGAPSGSVTTTLGNSTGVEYAWENAGDVNENMNETATIHVNAPQMAVSTSTT